MWEPVTDAPEPCGECGAVAWEAREDGDAGLIVRCASCGFRTGGSQLTMVRAIDVIVIDADPVEDWDAEDEDEDLEESFELVLEARFPVYAAAGTKFFEVGGSGGYGEPTARVELESAVGTGTVSVDTERPDTEWGAELPDLRNLVEAPRDVPERSRAGLLVWRRARKWALTEETRAFVIDGAPEPFAFIAGPHGWAARREHYGVVVTVVGEGIAPDAVELQRLVAPADPGAGTTPEPPRRVRIARGSMPSREEVAALVDEHGLDAHRREILDAIQVAFVLEPGPGPVRVGGLPDMAAGEVWPCDEHGIPYTFLAQIDCAALPEIRGGFGPPAWGHRGELVRVFAALDARLAIPGPAVALSCPVGTATTRAPLPPRPDPLPADAWDPDETGNRQLAEEVFLLRAFLSLPVADNVAPDDAFVVHGDDLHALADALGSGVVDERTRPQLLGYGVSEQGEDPREGGPFVFSDVPELAQMRAWQMLLDLPDRFSFGDGGSLGVVIPLADLAAGRYGRLATLPSMG